ncbi:MAG: Qat anti-phage system associated protein QatB [Alphaproteobacteria bacterium]
MIRLPRGQRFRSGPSARFTAVRTAVSKFADPGGTDRRNLRHAVSKYISKASGGAGRAAQRVGPLQRVGAGLVNSSTPLLTPAPNKPSGRSTSTPGRKAYRRDFVSQADYICPEGCSIDEGVARDAFIATIADLAGAGITDVDGLTEGQIQTILELYTSHAVGARLCNDIGTKVITLPADPRAAGNVQAQLHHFGQRGVSDAVSRTGIDVRALTPDGVTRLVADIYRSA